jgi:putative oxidoreductase
MRMRDLLGIDAAWGITVVRVMMGLLFAVHGYQKVSNGFGAVVASFAKMGIPTPQVTGPFIAGLELIGGLCLIVGLLARLFGFLFSCEMLVTTLLIQLPTRGWSGSDLDRMLLVSGLLLLLAGPGKLAIDQLWLERARPEQSSAGRDARRR